MTDVYLAGTGVPTPNAQRMGSCVVVVVEGEPILFDCGRGAATQLVKLGLDPWRVKRSECIEVKGGCSESET